MDKTIYSLVLLTTFFVISCSRECKQNLGEKNKSACESNCYADCWHFTKTWSFEPMSKIGLINTLIAASPMTVGLAHAATTIVNGGTVHFKGEVVATCHRAM